MLRKFINQLRGKNESLDDEVPLTDNRLNIPTKETENTPVAETITNAGNVRDTDDVKSESKSTASTKASELTANAVESNIQNEVKPTTAVAENKPVLTPVNVTTAKQKPKPAAKQGLVLGDQFTAVGENDHPLAINETKEEKINKNIADLFAHEKKSEKKSALSNAFEKVGQAIRNALNAFADALKNAILIVNIIGNKLMNAFTSNKKNKHLPKLSIKESLKQKKERAIADDKIRQKQSYQAYLAERKKPLVDVSTEEKQQFMKNLVNKQSDGLNADNSVELLSKEEIFANKLAEQRKINQSKLHASETYRDYVATQKQPVEEIQLAPKPAKAKKHTDVALTLKKLFTALGKPIHKLEEKRAAKKALVNAKQNQQLRSKDIFNALTEDQDSLFYQYKNNGIFNTSNTKKTAAQGADIKLDNTAPEIDVTAASAIQARR